jgi:hypothetical protein
MGRYAGKVLRPLSELAVIDQSTIDLIVSSIPSDPTPREGVTLLQVKTDTEIASTITLKHSNSLDHSHTNKTTLDTYSQSETDLASAVSLKHSNSLDHSNSQDHTHSNLSTLGSIQEALTTALKSDYDGAVTHAGSTHAPSTAQKNSDISKAEIEAKLTGELTSHTHAGGSGGLTQSQILTRQL